MVRKLAGISAAGLILMAPRVMEGCSPALEPPPLEETYRRAALVFRGELVAAAPHRTDRCGDETLTFLPSKVWKGPPTGPLVLTNKSVGRRPDGRLPAFRERVCIIMCPVRVVERKEYLVFAFGPNLQLQYGHSPLETSHEVAQALMLQLDEMLDRTYRERPSNDELQRTSDGKLPARR